MNTYNLIKYKIWKLLNLYNDMNQIFIQYKIKKLKTIIYSCDDSLENNVDFVLSSCAFKSLTEFYNENNLKYENNMQFKYYDILVKAHYLSYSIIKYINNLDPYSNMIDLRCNLLELLDQDIKISYNLYTSLSKIFKQQHGSIYKIIIEDVLSTYDSEKIIINNLKKLINIKFFENQQQKEKLHQHHTQQLNNEKQKIINTNKITNINNLTNQEQITNINQELITNTNQEQITNINQEQITNINNLTNKNILINQEQVTNINQEQITNINQELITNTNQEQITNTNNLTNKNILINQEQITNINNLTNKNILINQELITNTNQEQITNQKQITNINNLTNKNILINQEQVTNINNLTNKNILTNQEQITNILINQEHVTNINNLTNINKILISNIDNKFIECILYFITEIIKYPDKKL